MTLFSLTLYALWSIQLVFLLLCQCLVVMALQKLTMQRRLDVAFVWSCQICFWIFVKWLFDSGDLQLIGVTFFVLKATAFLLQRQGELAGKQATFIEMLSYLSFFPTLLAGPIEFFSKLSPQLDQLAVRKFWDRHTVWLLGWGFFQKLAIANSLRSEVLEPLNADFMSGKSSLGHVCLFGLAVFCYMIADFGGYSTLSRGFARAFGVELSLNFRNPLFVKSLFDAWSRFHVSFYQWLKDFIYRPLAQKSGYLGKLIALMFVGLVSGIAHGLNLEELVWGILNGTALVSYLMITKNVVGPLSEIVNISLTYVFIILLGSMFYLNSVPLFVSAVAGLGGPIPHYLLPIAIYFIIITAPLILVEAFEAGHREVGKIANITIIHLIAAMIGLIWFLFFARFNEVNFAYFQF